MFKSNLIFVIFMVAQWQLFAVQADEKAQKEAEKAVKAKLSDSDLKLWEELYDQDTEDLVSECNYLLQYYDECKKKIVNAYFINTDLIGKSDQRIKTNVLHLKCVTKKDKEYIITPGNDGTYIVSEDISTTFVTKRVPMKVIKPDDEE